MAGRRKKQENLTLEQQLEAVTNEIAECEAHLKELKEKKKNEPPKRSMELRNPGRTLMMFLLRCPSKDRR